MPDSCEQRYSILKSLVKEKDVSIEKVDRAYNVAKRLHKGQVRKDGTEYISHPIEVAIILAQLNFGVDVVCAALLHDTVEDCGITISQLSEKFGEEVAFLVDTVSAIDKTKIIYDDFNIYEDRDFIKSSAEEQTFKKLVKIGKRNPLGFYVKLADRLHNLRTIDIFPYNKQLEKIRETERWILPIAEVLHAEFFYREIKNECFKVINKQNSDFFLHYEDYHNSNVDNFSNLITNIQENFITSPFTEVTGSNIKEYRVFESLSEKIKNVKIDEISQGQILKVANYNIYLLFNEEMRQERALSAFLDIYFNKKDLAFDVINAKIGNFTKEPYFLIKDKYRNLYNLCVLSEKVYYEQLVGKVNSEELLFLDEENTHKIVTNYIKVKTLSDEIKYMPPDSTVLDFAFKIHRDIGFGFKYAIINGSRTRFPAYTKLNNFDKVEIVVDKDSFGAIKNQAKIRWLTYVSDDMSKKILVRYFENKE